MIHCAVVGLEADEEPAKKRSKGRYHQGQEQNDSSGLISVRRYIELGFGTELSFWNEWSTLGSLQKVRNRDLSVDSLAREWGVSRAEVLRQCGDIKSEEELENERKLLQLEKFEERVQKAGFIKKESHLEQQIKEAEQRAEVLSDYERMRLENMRERQALLEELNMDKERKEIAEEKQRGMIFTPKHEIKRRAPSARLKTLREKERLSKEETSRYWKPKENQVSPRWVGQWLSPVKERGEARKLLVPKFSSENRIFHVPRSELSLKEISTQNKGPDSK